MLGALPERFDAFGWHYYTYDVPAGAEELVRGPRCNQAFRLGDCAWGIQFHAEVTLETVRLWLDDEDEFPLDRDRDALWAETRERIVVVKRLIRKRVGAPVAVQCYVDNSPPPPPREAVAPAGIRDRGTGRPTKRDRREMERLRGLGGPAPFGGYAGPGGPGNSGDPGAASGGTDRRRGGSAGRETTGGRKTRGRGAGGAARP